MGLPSWNLHHFFLDPLQIGGKFEYRGKVEFGRPRSLVESGRAKSEERREEQMSNRWIANVGLCLVAGVLIASLAILFVQNGDGVSNKLPLDPAQIQHGAAITSVSVHLP